MLPFLCVVLGTIASGSCGHGLLFKDLTSLPVLSSHQIFAIQFQLLAIDLQGVCVLSLLKIELTSAVVNDSRNISGRR